MSGSALECISSYKYLGIVISTDLTWGNHIKGITTKARKQIRLLYRQFYKHAQQDTLRALYVVLIRPHLEYGIPVPTKVYVKSWNSLDYHERLDKLNLETVEKRRFVFNYAIISTSSWPVQLS